MEEYNVDIEKINSQIEEWVSSNLHKNFRFRKHQKEAIAKIIWRIVNQENHNIICEAPTGTGKSLINIISSQVLWEYYQIDSYILCSDLYLFDQYEKFVKDNPQLKNLACIKGQTGNYKCHLSGNDIRMAECQLSGVSWYSLVRKVPHVLAKGFRCCEFCEYVKAREKALKSPVTITTYQNALYQLNIVYKQKAESCEENRFGFGERNVMFCDEAHNIPDVIRLKYTPEIRYSDIHRYLHIVNAYNMIKLSPKWEEFKESLNDELKLIYTVLEQNPDEFNEEQKKSYTDFTDIEVIKEKFDKIWSVYITEKLSIDDLIEALNVHRCVLDGLHQVSKIISFWITYNKRSKYDKISDDLLSIWKDITWLANYTCAFSDFNTAWTMTGSEYILKEIGDRKDPNIEENFKKSLFGVNAEEKVVTFNCTKEDYLVYDGLLSWAKFRVFTSATIGGLENFSENNGIHYTEDGFASFDRVPTIFDFTKSPIHFYNRYSLSFKEREASFPKILKIVQKLCDRHAGEKGIIQTGSYVMAKQLADSLTKETQSRLLSYKGSREKIKMAEIHKNSQNTILIGPSLNQGIDLPDDHVRFIIILKVPYPSLTDEYVKRKIRLFPHWYESVTSTEIIQGIGRGVRNENDWCVTYILDSCFYKLYLNTMDQYSDEMRDRIKIYN